MPLNLTKRSQDSPYWYVRGTVAGIAIFESTGTTDKGQANAYRIKREKEVYDFGALGIQQPAKFSEAVDAYLDAGGEDRFLTPLNDHFRDMPISAIDQKAIDRAAQELYPDAGPATRVRQVYGPMAAVINKAARLKMTGASYIRLDKPEIPRKPVQRATWEHSDALIAAADPCMKAWVLVSSATGLRASEMIRQRRPDFAVRPGWVSIGRTKNGEPALVPLTEAALEAVAAIMPRDDETPIYKYTTVQGVNKALRRAAKAAGVPYLSTHKIGRHTFAGRILDAAHSTKILKEAGRWKKMQVVDEIYGYMEISPVHKIMVEVAEGKKRENKS